MAKKDEFVIDSSVVTKWFVDEPNSDRAIQIRDEFATGRFRLAAPTLLFYEVMNALRFTGAFNESDLVVASKSLSKYQFEVWRPRGKLLELSTQLSVRGDVTVYDACYIALAQRIGSRLITEDMELLAKFPKLAMAMTDQMIVRTDSF
ncbi:MAG: type II toxin-antitoxin system VapC family toxin [Thaumarchaeota archaeon]|nr:type II toxin-antitoxin system VapC family toxin [Nitrososphaerota archaeon]